MGNTRDNPPNADEQMQSDLEQELDNEAQMQQAIMAYVTDWCGLDYGDATDEKKNRACSMYQAMYDVYRTDCAYWFGQPMSRLREQAGW